MMRDMARAWWQCRTARWEGMMGRCPILGHANLPGKKKCARAVTQVAVDAWGSKRGVARVAWVARPEVLRRAWTHQWHDTSGRATRRSERALAVTKCFRARPAPSHVVV